MISLGVLGADLGEHRELAAPVARSSSRLRSGSSAIVPSETSTWRDAQLAAARRSSPSRRPSRSAISVSVPPSTTGTSCARVARELGSRLPVTSAVPQPSLTMSTRRPRPPSGRRPRRTTGPCRARASARARAAWGCARGGRGSRPTDAGYCDWSAPIGDRRRRRRPAPATTAVLWSIGCTASVPTSIALATTSASRLVARRVLDERGRARLVGGVGDRADLEARVLQPVGDAAGEARDRRAVEHRDRDDAARDRRGRGAVASSCRSVDELPGRRDGERCRWCSGCFFFAPPENTVEDQHDGDRR